MPRPPRALAFVTAFLVSLVLLTVSGLGVAPALAAARPSISAVGSGAGPLEPSTIVISGKNLAGAKAVKFGSNKGKILRQISSTAVEVRTPKGVKAGPAYVRIETKGGWSKKSETARFTFVAKPTLSSLSPSRGSFVGGEQVTLSGKNLALASKVIFGTVEAKIVTQSAKKIVVISPIGVLGATAVSVTTPGGTTKPKTYTYITPATKDTKTLDTTSDTFRSTEVEWVTGGYDADTGTTDPWVVSLPQGAAAPTVGQSFLLAPGGDVFPAGLAGTVDDVAVQADETTRITVLPTDLDKAFDRLSVDYQGPATGSTTGNRRRAVETAIEFPINSSALFCHDPRGQSVAVGADFTMRVTDVDVSQLLDLGGLISRPTYDASLTAEVELAGKFHGEAASTCDIGAAWANAHRRVIPIGTSGATVSFAPAMQLSVSAKGTLTFKDRSRTTFAVAAELGKQPRFSSTSRTVEQTVGGALSFGVGLAAGVEVRFGLLDRAGLSSKALLGATIDLEAANANVCINGKFVLKLSVNLFVDAFVARWDSPSLTATIDLRQFAHTCVRRETDPPPTGEPQITSARMADATIGSDYSDTLETSDNRAGSWSVVGYALPAGLSLDPNSGRIAGTPIGPVGDQPTVIDFKDGQGKVATTVIRIRVRPATGIGGGDIQATLRWTGAADLDLHVLDAANEEIYYGHPTSTSGGTLDHDANAGCNGPEDDDNAVENVFWPPHSAPAGSYTAFVHVYLPCDAPLDWHLTVRRNGAVIIDQTGNGNSDGFTFTIGSSGRVRVADNPVRVPARHYPAK